MPSSPTFEQIEEVAAVARTEADAPLVMLNLSRYRERAHYDGGQAALGGN